ncbi:MAG: GGDEF domain-containing protein [Candidatus Gracilibacteria bacterium]|nr:GGDEF domain-containing protein [Candidatus Gracilibacteria bacterium]
MTDRRFVNETPQFKTPLKKIQYYLTVVDIVKQAYNSIFGNKVPTSSVRTKGERYQPKDPQNSIQSSFKEPKPATPLLSGEENVAKLAPILVVNNTPKSLPVVESMIQLSLGNAGHETLDAIQNARSITELIHCVREDYVRKIRAIEATMSIAEKSSLNLMGDKGINIAVVILESLLPEYKFVQKELAENCELIKGNGGRINRTFDDNSIGYGLPYNPIQIIFDWNITAPTDMYNTPPGHTVPYHQIIWKNLIPMMEAFRQRLKEINTQTRDMYLDSLTGLFNTTSYNEVIEKLNNQGRPYALYFIEINRESIHLKKLGYYGKNALLQTFADKVKAMGADQAFLVHEDGKEYIVFIDVEAHNSTQKRKEFEAIYTSFPGDILLSEYQSSS